MRKSFVEYITALGHWGWVVFVSVISSTIGTIRLAIEDVPMTQNFWLWILIIVLLVVPFIAFHKVRVQRDEAKLKLSGIVDRIIVVSNYDYEFETLPDSIRLRLDPDIHAIPAVLVEDIKFEIKAKRYDVDSEWLSMNEPQSGDFGGYVYVNLPSSLRSGTYKARLVAIIENREYYSDPFDLKYEKPSQAR